MRNLKIILPAFIFVAIAQLYVPAQMIWDREKVLEGGVEYKFKTAPIDPSDPLRGKYINLHMEENSLSVDNEQDWVRGETIYVLLATDAEGFAKAKSITKEKPTSEVAFIEANLSYITTDGSNQVFVDYPFERYYMEESKAYDAEQTYRQSLLDTARVTYAVVNIKEGEAVLRDVMIDGISIKDLVTPSQ